MAGLLVVCYLLVGFVAASVTVSVHKFLDYGEYGNYDISVPVFMFILTMWPGAMILACGYYILVLLDVYINFLQRRL
jgi:hypothetical protein